MFYKTLVILQTLFFALCITADFSVLQTRKDWRWTPQAKTTKILLFDLQPLQPLDTKELYNCDIFYCIAFSELFLSQYKVYTKYVFSITTTQRMNWHARRWKMILKASLLRRQKRGGEQHKHARTLLLFHFLDFVFHSTSSMCKVAYCLWKDLISKIAIIPVLP